MGPFPQGGAVHEPGGVGCRSLRYKTAAGWYFVAMAVLGRQPRRRPARGRGGRWPRTARWPSTVQGRRGVSGPPRWSGLGEKQRAPVPKLSQGPSYLDERWTHGGPARQLVPPLPHTSLTRKASS